MRIMNSTIADNQADQAVILFSGTLTITNSVMYNNHLNLQVSPPCPSCFVVNYTNIQGGWPGIGNIDADPKFVDAANGDYHLNMSSPCTDKGTNSGAPDHDLDKTTRPLDGDGDGTAVTDMGAYESTLYQTYLPYTMNKY